MTYFIMILSFLSWLNPSSKKFKELICSYDLENISIEISKKELIKGFEKIDKLACIKDLNISSFWFSRIRNNQQSQTEIIKFEDRKKIPELLKGLKKGDIINFTLTCNLSYLQRRDKTIKIK